LALYLYLAVRFGPQKIYKWVVAKRGSVGNDAGGQVQPKKPVSHSCVILRRLGVSCSSTEKIAKR